MKVTRRRVEYVAYLVLTGYSILSARSGRHLRLFHVLFRPLLRGGDRILRAAEGPRVTSDPRLSAETAPSRSAHVRGAVRLLAWTSQVKSDTV